jgi:hypothetical protein
MLRLDLVGRHGAEIVLTLRYYRRRGKSTVEMCISECLTLVGGMVLKAPDLLGITSATLECH